MPLSSPDGGHSFSIAQRRNCPSCASEFDAELWLIVDAGQRLDLVDLIRAGRLHEVTCPNCGETGPVDAPLLVYRPDAEPPLLFSPASRTSREQNQKHVAQLVGALRQSLGEAWRHDWLAQGRYGVSRDALPALLRDDLEAALAELQQRVAADFQQRVAAESQRLWQEDPERFCQLQQQLAAAEFERLRQQDPERFRQLQEEAAREAMSHASPVQRTLVQFLEAETWTDCQRIVAQNPELLGDEADEMLGRAVEAARGQGDHQAAGGFQERRDLLRRCREAGVARAFAEKMLPAEALARAEAEGLAPEELLEMQQPAAQVLREILAELAAGGVEIRSPEDLEWALAARPELQGKLAAATQKAGGGPDVPAEFRADVHQAKEAVRRYVSRGDAAALDAAAAAWERIVDHPGFVGSDARFQLAVLNDAGGVFLRRYRARGRLDDLNRALALSRQAVERTPPDSPDLPSRLNNLGSGLNSRYARTGLLEDLEEAIRVFQQAVQRTPPDSPDLPPLLNNLGTGLCSRYARTGRLEDLEEAIRVFQQAVQRTPPDSPDLPSLLNNLGNGLNSRYACTGRLEDLEEGIWVSQQAVQRTPPDSPDLSRNLNNLGNRLCSRHMRTGRLEDLEEATGCTSRRSSARRRTRPTCPHY